MSIITCRGVTPLKIGPHIQPIPNDKNSLIFPILWAKFPKYVNKLKKEMFVKHMPLPIQIKTVMKMILIIIFAPSWNHTFHPQDHEIYNFGKGLPVLFK